MGSAPEMPPRPTLEELLRYKRSERPAPEFWADFDRGLRQKQLSALMKQPKGWAKLRPMLARGMKWAVPVTAAAAVAVVVVQIPLSSVSRQVPVEVVSMPVHSGQPLVRESASSSGQHEVSVASAERDAALRQAAPVAAAPLVSDPVVVPVASLAPVEQVLPWAATSLTPNSEVFALSGSANQARPAVQDERRYRSSWTSRYNTLAREIATTQTQERTLQLVAYDLQPETKKPAGRSLTEQTLAANTRVSREPDERVLRSLEARLGASGSGSLSIKF